MTNIISRSQFSHGDFYEYDPNQIGNVDFPLERGGTTPIDKEYPVGFYAHEDGIVDLVPFNSSSSVSKPLTVFKGQKILLVCRGIRVALTTTKVTFFFSREDA